MHFSNRFAHQESGPENEIFFAFYKADLEKCKKCQNKIYLFIYKKKSKHLKNKNDDKKQKCIKGATQKQHKIFKLSQVKQRLFCCLLKKLTKRQIF